MKRIISLLLVMAMLFGIWPINTFANEHVTEEHNTEVGQENALPQGEQADCVEATGKHSYEMSFTCSECGYQASLSVLGDSISTFTNYSNGTAAGTTNSTITNGAVYYPRSGFDVTADSTWWSQAAKALGMEILVNNSWSGSCLLNTRSGAVGAYVDRCVQLHDDTGDNAGQKPDIIAIFLGTNDYYTYPDTLGSFESIDFDQLITREQGVTTYGNPATSMEAYAIILDKIGIAYPDAEVYCFTLLPRYNSSSQPADFNEDIAQLAEKYGAYVVDLYNCGIRSEAAAFNLFMGDSLHPNNAGMDAMTNAFISAVLNNSEIMAESTTYDVEFRLEDVVALEGTTRTVWAGESFEATLKPMVSGLKLRVSVQMGGKDITDSCYEGGVIRIPNVSGDVIITASLTQRDPLNFRWETQEDALVSIVTDGNAENVLTMTAGSISGGVFSKVKYTMAQAVSLKHDQPWVIEWYSEGTWSDTTDGALLFAGAATSATADKPYLYRRHNSDFIALGVYTGGQYHNYGVSLKANGIDGTVPHSYRLVNRVSDDGSNMVYLYVDNEEIGPMNHHWVGGTDKNETVNWLDGQDLVFTHMGTSPHTIGNCSIEYIQVWEKGIPCNHSYTAQVTAPTCTEKGYTDYTCPACGDSYRTLWLDETAYEGKTIACVGDSITAAYGVTKDETDYVKLLADQLGMNYIRLGASGTTLCTDGSRTCNIGKLTEANLKGADIVTIAMGINDFCAAGAGYYELGDINSTDTSTIYGAARMWCERIEELRKTDSLSTTQFYFMTPVITSWNSSVTSTRDWDQAKTNIHGYTLRDLCNAIMEVAALYDVAVIDMNLLSGMYYVDETDNNTAVFGGDGVHPGDAGHAMMAAALANALLQNDQRDDHNHTYGSWITTTWPTCTAGEQQRVCSICTATESCAMDSGAGHRYQGVVTLPTNTQQGYTTYTCTLCGDSYVGDYTDSVSPKSYRWEMQESALVSVSTNGNTENILTLSAGSVSNGTLTNVRGTLQEGVLLYHNMPWVIEWRSSGNWDGMLLASTDQSSSVGLTYLFRFASMKFLAFGEYTGTWNNYGVIHDIDMTASHVFRLENRIAADGTNAVYLLVDGQEIGTMDNYYVGGTNKNQTVNWANGKDLVFSNIGTSSHPVKGMKLDYLQIWEGGHVHTYKSTVTSPTCTERGYTTYTCDCGDSYVDDYVDALGHTTVIDSGIRENSLRPGVTEGSHCGTCGEVLEAQQEIPAKGYDWMLEDGEFKLLLIGNSFSQDASSCGFGMTESQLYNMLQAMLGEDVKVTLGLLYSGGKGVHWYATQTEQGTKAPSFYTITPEKTVWTSWGGTSTETALNWTDWDVVTLQPYDVNFTKEQEGVPEKYKAETDEKFYPLETATEYMLDFIGTHAPQADVYCYMHWARSSATVASLNASLSTYQKFAEFYPKGLDYLGTETGNRYAGIIPVGLSIQNARTTYLSTLSYNIGAAVDLQNDPQIGLQRDGGHVTFNVGRYIAGLTFAEMLIPQELRVDGYVLPGIRVTESVGELPQEYTRIAQKCVTAAVNSWRNGSLAVTTMEGYAEDPTVAARKTLEAMTLTLHCGDQEAQIKTDVLSALPADFAVDAVSLDTENNSASVTVRFGYSSVTVAVACSDVKHTYENGVCTGCGAVNPDAVEPMALRYDDHVDMTGKVVEILDAGNPTSYQVGYGVEENKVLDTAVVTLEGNTLVATGIGTAMIRIDGTLYEVTVEAAPISLLLLIGQSNMRGSEGNADQSIVCPDGMVYATFGDDRGDAEGIMNVNNATKFAASALTGPYSTINVEGTTEHLSYYPINSLTEAGAGTFGPDSGFAYEWVQQTGEKVWVVNAAHGGSAISSWQPNGTNFKEAVLLFQACQETLQKEIAAGHFTLSHMGYFWCQGCNDAAMTAEQYVAKYLTMHENLKSTLEFDHDSDASTDTVAFEFAGIIPILYGVNSYRADEYKDPNNYTYYQSFEQLTFNGPRVAQYWMCNNPELEDIWMVCNIGEDWVWMPDNTNGVTAYFQSHYENGTVDYTTQVAQKASWYTPTTPAAVHDSIHYNQIGYNEIGRESARNALIMLGEIAAPEVETTVELLSWDGYIPVEQVTASLTGNSGTLVVPKVYPVWKTKEVTYTLSDNLIWSYYDLLVKDESLDGTLTMLDKTVAVKGHQWSEWVVISEPTPEGPGLEQRTCGDCGKVETKEVKGVWQIYKLADHLLELPENICCDTNLWPLLPHEDVHFTSGKTWGKVGIPVPSITIPVNPGDRIFATSFQKAVVNGHETSNGIRVTFFDAYGIAKTMGPGQTDKEFYANGGYLIAPEGTIAVNIAMWYENDDYEVYILNREHCYENGICAACGAEAPTHTLEKRYQGKVISILGDSISTFAGYIPTADGFNMEHLARYPQDNLLTDVHETWWMRVIDSLDAKLGINDSWRGATVSGAAPVTTGTTGENAAMHNLTRIQNLGSNGTPDVILFYGGTNDLAHVSKVGTFDPENAPDTVDLVTKKWDNLADGYVQTILLLRYYYPEAQIICLLPTYTTSYYSNEKLAQGNQVLAEICEHYGVAYVDLRYCGIGTGDLPDGIHPDAQGMAYIAEAVLELLDAQKTMEPGEHRVYAVSHDLDHVTASLGHYKGISAGNPFRETLQGENLTVSVTMGGVDITDSCYHDGVIDIEAVTGDLVITATASSGLESRLQQLPDPYEGVNLWQVLNHDSDYYAANGWEVHSSGKVKSVTIPVEEDQRIWASSFGSAETNGGTVNGIRVTFFSEYGVLKSMSTAEVYEEFTKNGFLRVPQEAVAVCIPMWTDSNDWELYLWTGDRYTDHLQALPENICGGTNLWSLLEHDSEYYTGSGWAQHGSGQACSVTIPIQSGDRIWATSFQMSGTNGGSMDGIRITWFAENGVLKSVSADAVYQEWEEAGFLTAPEGAVAVNVVMWNNSQENALYILNLEHSYEDGHCTHCGTVHTSTFQILDTRCNRVETFTYEVGMTWKQWLNSKYNTGMGSVIAIWVSEGPDILDRNHYMDIFINGDPADYDAEICEEDVIELIRYQ